jgi:hypothetical protein
MMPRSRREPVQALVPRTKGPVAVELSLQDEQERFEEFQRQEEEEFSIVLLLLDAWPR